MGVIDHHNNYDDLTVTMVAEFAAPVERVWEVWADRTQLERWWGPPTYPATFVEHQLVPGGRAHYFMTSPEGDRYHGCWEVLAVDAPHSLEVEDAFADDRGAPNPELPVTRMRLTLSPTSDGTRMDVVTTFASRSAMDEVLAMGVEEGMTAAMNQIDAIVASPAAGR